MTSSRGACSASCTRRPTTRSERADDEPATKERLPKIQESVNYATTALCSFKGNDPKDWNVNSDAHLTVVVAAKGKVVARFAYKSVNDTDAPNVVKALTKVAAKK